jgi:hypothetical protein
MPRVQFNVRFVDGPCAGYVAYHLVLDANHCVHRRATDGKAYRYRVDIDMSRAYYFPKEDPAIPAKI